MRYNQIPKEYCKILIKASQEITPASSIIAEEIQDDRMEKSMAKQDLIAKRIRGNK